MTGAISDLTAAIVALGPTVKSSETAIWTKPSALRTIDCVLSLRNKYNGFVVPRVEAFETARPEIRSVRDLRHLIAHYESPFRFLTEELSYRSERRGDALNGVVEWLCETADAASEADELRRLQDWARKADPRQRPTIKYFGIAGFQYLRMLFGADTTKPDAHIVRWVQGCLRRRVSPEEVVALIETASLAAGFRVRDVDATLWSNAALGRRRRVN